MIKLVIFDLDDTLISEKDYVKSGYKEVSRKIKEIFKLDYDENKIYDLLIDEFNKNTNNVFNRLLDKYKISYSNEDIKLLIKTYREHIPQIEFYNDVIKTVNDLKEKEIKVAIVSDGYLETQKLKLKVLNAYKIFDKIILTEELGRKYWKPNPRAFELLKDFFCVQYNEIIYVGDNPLKDFYIKKYYPITTIKINRTDSIYKNKNYLEDIKEDYVVNKLEKIKMIIKENNFNESFTSCKN